MWLVARRVTRLVHAAMLSSGSASTSRARPGVASAMSGARVLSTAPTTSDINTDDTNCDHACGFGCHDEPSRPNRTAPSSTSDEAVRQARAAEAIRVLSGADAKGEAAVFKVIDRLDDDRRRYLLVAAGAREWFGESSVARQLEDADLDNDHTISSDDYRQWVTEVFEKRGGLSRGQMLRVALHTALPFVAFGFLDNTVMLLSGDLIDRMVGAALGLSVMATAALGGVVSGTMGIQMHGLAERAIEGLGFKAPPLSAAQRRHPTYFRATHLGGSAGICIGLCLGMFPLLFIEVGGSD